MPDVNQDNPLVATYMIQNFLWWVETLGSMATALTLTPIRPRNS